MFKRSLKYLILNKASYVILTVLIFIFGTSGLYFQGQVLEQIVLKEFHFKKLISFAFLLSSFQILSGLLKILIVNLKRYYKNLQFKKIWNLSFPSHVSSENFGDGAKYFNQIFINSPNVKSLELNMTTQIAAGATIFSIFFGKVFYDKFWEALVIVPILCVLSFLSSISFKEKLEANIRASSKMRAVLFQWCHDIFKIYRESKLNWKTGRN